MLALTIEGVSERTFTTTGLLNPGWYAAVFNLSGVGLIRSELSHRWYVASENSVRLFRDHSKLIMRVPKGRHRVEILLWRSQALPELHDWITTDLRLKNEGVDQPSLGSKPISPHLDDAFRRFQGALESREEAIPLLISVIGELVHAVRRSNHLARFGSDLPPQIRELVNRVQEEPFVSWPLKEAADEVGYSPFHFSRLFKQLAGIGFHEFVDRTRTDYAVELLCTTDDSVDSIATAAGFGTTQSLRESVKEYFGLVPTEFRSEPDEGLLS